MTVKESSFHSVEVQGRCIPFHECHCTYRIIRTKNRLISILYVTQYKRSNVHFHTRINDLSDFSRNYFFKRNYFCFNFTTEHNFLLYLRNYRNDMLSLLNNIQFISRNMTIFWYSKESIIFNFIWGWKIFKLYIFYMISSKCIYKI